MRVFFKQLGWNGVIGLVFGSLGMAAFLGASFHWLTTGSYFPGYLILGVSIFIIFAVWRGIIGPAVLMAQLAGCGEPAEARILGLKESGMQVQGGGSKRVGARLQVEVHPSNGQPAYPATMRLFISVFEIERYRPGETIRVLYDPKHPQRVGIASEDS